MRIDVKRSSSFSRTRANSARSFVGMFFLYKTPLDADGGRRVRFFAPPAGVEWRTILKKIAIAAQHTYGERQFRTALRRSDGFGAAASSLLLLLYKTRIECRLRVRNECAQPGISRMPPRLAPAPHSRALKP